MQLWTEGQYKKMHDAHTEPQVCWIKRSHDQSRWDLMMVQATDIAVAR